MKKILILLTAMAAVVACGGKEPEPGTTKKPAIEITLQGVTGSTADFALKTINCEYVCLYLTRSNAQPTDAEILSNGTKFYEMSASAANLEPLTDYYAWALPVGAKNVTGKVVCVKFRTLRDTGGEPQNASLRVMRSGEDVYISAAMDATSNIVYHFRKCMFNNLYTFYRVGSKKKAAGEVFVNPSANMDVVFNATSSDNIGPFWIVNYYFAGGNHSWREGGQVKTAKTISWKALADGVEVQSGADILASELTIEVTNEIYNPATEPAAGANILSNVMAVETMTYTVDGNSLKITGEHQWKVDADVYRYYGMQSMFENETHLLTPGQEYATWTARGTSGEIEISKTNCPDLNLFVERKNNEYFQAAYLSPKGMGDHGFVSGGGPTFIYGSYGKSYHVLISGHKFNAGAKSLWEGIYTWCAKPIVNDSSVFCHEGRVEGKKAIYVSVLTSADRVIPVAGITESTPLTTFDSRGNMSVTAAEGGLKISAASPAYVIVLID